MKNIIERAEAIIKHVIGSWITWVVLGAAVATVVLFSAGFGASEPDQAEAPTGLEIETAVARAENEANAARAAE